MSPSVPVYHNILNQPQAAEQVLAYQLDGGREPLGRVAELIRRAETVVVVAIGASYAASFPFRSRLAAAGKNVVLEDAAELLHYQARAYGPGAVFLLVSRSGETIEIVKLLRVLHERGAVTVGVTNEAESQLARGADHAILIGSPRDDLIAVQTYIGTLLTLNLLAEEVTCGLDAAAYRAELAAVAPAMTATLRDYDAARAGWRTSFRQTRAVYALARGASLASAHEAALVFHEMARFPAVALGAGHFRHGPWEVVDEDFTAHVFAPDDATYDLNISLAADIAVLGGEVRLVTARPPAQPLPGVTVWPVPRLDPLLTPLVEILPLQLLVYEFSLWRGLEPGVFRASLPITLSETGSKVTL